jgi:uncharacterized protein (DUF58 family)
MDGYLDNIETLDARQFAIAIKKLADNLSYGTDRSPFLGSGIEYVQSRPYQWGDPVRSVDWRVTARTGQVHIKEYEAPKRMDAYFLIDTSASMTVASVAPSKYALAIHVAGGLALACLDRVSPVGVVGVGGRDIRIAPSLSKSQILQWLHRFRNYRFDEPTTLSRRVAELSPSLKSRCLLVVFSDLHDSTALPVLKQLSQAHDVVVLQFADPAEKGMRGAGFLRAREAETGRHFTTRGGTQWLDNENVRQELKRAGVDHLVLQTGKPFMHDLRHFFESRDLLGRGAR